MSLTQTNNLPVYDFYETTILLDSKYVFEPSENSINWHIDPKNDTSENAIGAYNALNNIVSITLPSSFYMRFVVLKFQNFRKLGFLSNEIVIQPPVLEKNTLFLLSITTISGQGIPIRNFPQGHFVLNAELDLSSTPKVKMTPVNKEIIFSHTINNLTEIRCEFFRLDREERLILPSSTRFVPIWFFRNNVLTFNVKNLEKLLYLGDTRVYFSNVETNFSEVDKYINHVNGHIITSDSNGPTLKPKILRQNAYSNLEIINPGQVYFPDFRVQFPLIFKSIQYKFGNLALRR